MSLGSGVRKKTHSGSRIQGSKRHRIPDLDPQHCTWVRALCIEIVTLGLARCIAVCRKGRRKAANYDQGSCLTSNKTRQEAVLLTVINWENKIPTSTYMTHCCREEKSVTTDQLAFICAEHWVGGGWGGGEGERGWINWRSNSVYVGTCWGGGRMNIRNGGKMNGVTNRMLH